jgi:pyruvate dehydrogenase E1 component beta subunit
VLYLENELDYGMKMEIPTEEYLVPIGKAKVVKEGKDVTLISYSRMFNLCQSVTEMARRENIDVELIDLRTIKPLDIATIAHSIRKTNRCVLVEEGHSFSGICSEIGFQIQEHCFDFLDAPIVRVCQKETPMPYSKVLEAETLPTKEKILSALKQAVK